MKSRKEIYVELKHVIKDQLGMTVKGWCQSVGLHYGKVTKIPHVNHKYDDIREVWIKADEMKKKLKKGKK